MKKIIRLTESDLHNLIQRSVKRVLREQDETLLLQNIAQTIAQKNWAGLDVNMGENDYDFKLQNGLSVYITYEVSSDPYVKQGKRNSSYEECQDEVIDNPTVEILSLEVTNKDGEYVPIQDNGIVKQALENTIKVDYGGYDIPSEEEYFFDDDSYYD